jgi:serine phosphatase RsbU (regulator of sigma subunit)
MQHSLFPSQRPKHDYIFFALGIVACVAAYSLRGYSPFQPPSFGNNAVKEHALDSLKRAYRLAPDSLTTSYEVSYESSHLDSLSRFLTDSLGLAGALDYCRRHDMLELTNRLELDPKSEFRGGALSFGRRSGGSQRRNEFTDTATYERHERYEHILWFSRQGTIVKTESLHRLTLPSDSRDTAQIIRVLAALAPSTLVPTTLESSTTAPSTTASAAALARWRYTQTADEHTITTILSTNANNDRFGFQSRLTIRARQASAPVAAYRVTWERSIDLPSDLSSIGANAKASAGASARASAGTAKTNQDDDDSFPVKKIVHIGTISLLIAMACMLFITYFLRMRKRLSSLALSLSIGAITVAWIALQGPGRGVHSFWELLFVIFLMFCFAGFIMYGIPFAGMVALMRESFAEKFYTIKRIFAFVAAPRTAPAPHHSFYVGRSILFGLSLGAMLAAIGLVQIYALDALGLGSWTVKELFDSTSYSLILDAPAMPALVPATIFFFSGIIFFSLFVLPTIFYRFVPERWFQRSSPATSRITTSSGGVGLSNGMSNSMSASTGTSAETFARLDLRFWLMVFFTCVGLALWRYLQTESWQYALVDGIVQGLWAAFVLRRFDVLTLALMVFVALTLNEINLLQAFPVLQGSWLLGGAAVLSLGIVAYRRAPEPVSENEYKPEFLLEKEENARLHQELAAAKTVQQRLLPTSVPIVNSIEMCAACIPAYEVGGDYYDFFQLDHKRLGILIGDVSGKGISAAFYITLAKGVIVSQVRQEGSPAEVLHRVNALLYGVMERGKFVSMIYGVFDLETRIFSFANAGHNPALMRLADGSTQFIPSRGMALGLDKGPRFDKAVVNAEIRMNAGDTLVLYTDGVTEAMNGNNEEYTEERLLRVAARTKTSGANSTNGSTVNDIVSTIIDDVRDFTGRAPQHDDITVVALRSLPSSLTTTTEAALGGAGTAIGALGTL